MNHEVDLYDSHYGHLAADPQMEVRQETNGEDLGQASWITADEARRWFDLLQVGRGGRIREVACGSGGVTCAMADQSRAEGARARGLKTIRSRNQSVHQYKSLPEVMS